MDWFRRTLFHIWQHIDWELQLADIRFWNLLNRCWICHAQLSGIGWMKFNHEGHTAKVKLCSTHLMYSIQTPPPSPDTILEFSIKL